MSEQELKPCPICGSECEQDTHSRIRCADKQCSYWGVPRDVHSTLPRLSELEQQWLKLAPPFDTDKYDYEMTYLTPVAGGFKEVWNPHDKQWHDKASDNDYGYPFARRKKAPAWAVEKGETAYHLKKNEEIVDSIDLDKYEQWVKLISNE